MPNVSDISHLSIDAAHPCLPGHFPGQPIVPGVLLLDRVLDRAQQCLQQKVRVAALPVAKFTRPLLPGETATLHLEILDAEIKFEITKDDARIAQGSFRIDRGTTR
jgi:3-hydroxymyristoyl/3-hydroxydecanoyl-(acyl carrier protein) dehydratase